MNLQLVLNLIQYVSAFRDQKQMAYSYGEINTVGTVERFCTVSMCLCVVHELEPEFDKK